MKKWTITQDNITRDRWYLSSGTDIYADADGNTIYFISAAAAQEAADELNAAARPLKTIADFIRTAQAHIGKQYLVSWPDGRSATRTLARIINRSELVSRDNCHGSELNSKNSEWDGETLRVFVPVLDWDEDGRQIWNWDNKILSYTVKFMD